MRAILIDPENKTISEIDVDVGMETIHQVIGCKRFACGSRPLRGSFAEGFDALYVSDDDLEDRDDTRFWFQVDAERKPPLSHPLTGRGLVCGVDENGESCGAKIGLTDLAARITFTRRKFLGFVVSGGVVEALVPIVAEN